MLANFITFIQTELRFKFHEHIKFSGSHQFHEHIKFSGSHLTTQAKYDTSNEKLKIVVELTTTSLVYLRMLDLLVIF